MGFSFYCFYPKKEDELITKSDIDIKNEENEQKESESKNIITSSNVNKSSIVSPLFEQRNIFINPIPEIVTIKPKKSSFNY